MEEIKSSIYEPPCKCGVPYTQQVKHDTTFTQDRKNINTLSLTGNTKNNGIAAHAMENNQLSLQRM